MKRLWFAVLALGLALHAWPAHADDPAAGLTAGLGELDAARNSGDCAAVLPAARKVIASPAFAGSDPDIRGAVLVLAAGCADHQFLSREALDDARLATEIPGASIEAWRIRFEAAMALNAPGEFVAAVEQAAVAAPEAVAATPIRDYRDFDRNERTRDTQLEQRMLAALDKANYRPDRVDESADDLWLRYAQLLADAGDNDRAAAVLARVGDVRMLLQVKLDRRFAAVVAANPDRFDLKAAAERKLAQDQAAMAAHPERLGEVQATIEDLDTLNRFDEAVALAQSALDRAAKQTADQPAFTDEPAKLVWIYDGKAVVLLEQGRIDEAIATERTAMGANTSTQPNASQAINLALFLNLAGRSDEALKTLDASLDHELSPYGLAWLHTERACADQQLGHAADLAGELAYLSAHAADNPGASVKALLCVNDLDGAAVEMVRDLRNPERRGQALINLSTFTRLAQRTPISATLHDRLAAVAARPDVQAAVAAAGRTEAIPLNSNRFIDVF